MRFILFSLSLICLAAWPGSLAAQGTTAANYSPAQARTQTADDATRTWAAGATQPSPTPSPGPLPLPAAPRSPQEAAATLKLPTPNGQNDVVHHEGGTPPLAALGGSLAAVLGVFFLLAWFMRKVAPPGSAVLPGEAFEVLGRAPLAGRQQVQLLRCGNKLLLISLTQSSAKTLTEIIDPAAVDELTELCRRSRGQGAAAAFCRVFERLATARSVPFQPGDDECGGVDLTKPALVERRAGWGLGDV